MKKFLKLLSIAMLTMCIAASCDSEPIDNPKDPTNPSGPTTDGNDPAGTISLQISNSDSYQKPPIGEGLYMDANNNFVCKSGYICSYGVVNGLAYVNTIPTVGWVTSLKVTPGQGYVYYSSKESRYYRIYTIDYRKSLGGAIIGADVKYQSPFNGVDEQIVLEGVPTGSVTFPSDGTANFVETDGWAEFMFANTNIVTFTCEIDSKGAEWLTVEPCSSFQEPTNFIKNGIRVKVKPTDAPQLSSATIVIKTGFDKITTLSITRSGRAPFIEFDAKLSDDGYYVLPQGSVSKTISVSSNIELEQIQASSSQNWCTVSLSDGMDSYRSGFRKLGRKLPDAANELHSYALTITPEYNNGAGRTATVTLSSIVNNTTSKLEVKQDGATLSIAEKDAELYFTRSGGTVTVYLNTTAETLDAKSSQQWCGVAVQGRQLIIRVETAEINRKATITFPGFDDVKIMIDQSKYEVGDKYSEGSVEGVVCYMNGDVRYVRSELLGHVAWSTENLETGATSVSDGKANTDAIIKLTHDLNENIEEFYPAFALVNKLNVGTTGWYLPSADEARFLGVKPAWSSTQQSASQSIGINSNGSKSTINKSTEIDVYAIRKF